MEANVRAWGLFADKRGSVLIQDCSTTAALLAKPRCWDLCVFKASYLRFFPLKTIILGNRFLWRAEIKLMWFLWGFPCNERKPMVLCCLVPGQGRGPSWSGTRVISCCALSQEETACSPCGTLGQAVHTALTSIRTQWPVSAGLAELPEPPQHLLGACRDSLPLHFLFFCCFLLKVNSEVP